MWVCLIQPVKGLNRTKGLILSQVGGNSSCLVVYKQGHDFFPACGLKLKHWLLLGLRPATLWTETTPLAISGSPACQVTLQILELISFHSYVSRFLIANLIQRKRERKRKSMPPTGSVSLEEPWPIQHYNSKTILFLFWIRQKVNILIFLRKRSFSVRKKRWK